MPYFNGDKGKLYNQQPLFRTLFFSQIQTALWDNFIKKNLFACCFLGQFHKEKISDNYKKKFPHNYEKFFSQL